MLHHCFSLFISAIFFCSEIQTNLLSFSILNIKNHIQSKSKQICITQSCHTSGKNKIFKDQRIVREFWNFGYLTHVREFFLQVINHAWLAILCECQYFFRLASLTIHSHHTFSKYFITNILIIYQITPIYIPHKSLKSPESCSHQYILKSIYHKFCYMYIISCVYYCPH